jgi:outer membrane biosynthesis protein TonB
LVLREKIARAQALASGLEQSCREVDAELAALAGERPRYELLQSACAALEQLQDMGAAAAFWGDSLAEADQAAVLRRVRGAFDAFSHEVLRVEQARAGLVADLQRQRDVVADLEDALADVVQAEEDVKFEFVVDRDAVTPAFRPAVMPWSAREEDERRLRKVLRFALLLMLFIGVVPQFWTLPVRDRNQPVEIPDRLVQMLKKQEPKPVETPREIKREQPEEQKTAKKEDKPTPVAEARPTEVRQARARAETKGVLAFKDSFSDLIDDAAPSRLGADARITNAGAQANGGAPGYGAAGTRSLIAAQANGGSGGIANAGISRGGVGNGNGGAITGSGMQVGRAQSSVAADVREASRPLGKGAGPARTDEEIQIVFDRYKAALYRLYNRELRNDPTLRGKMVLALTIEPDGRVSACRVQSTDMNSPALSADVVDRVLKFNFGAKDGVPVTKILYPIDFLPAG